MGNGLEAEVVKDKEACFFELIEPLDDGAFGFSHSNLLAESVHVEVEGAFPKRAGMIFQGASEVRFTAAGSAGDHDVFASGHPGGVGEYGKLAGGEVTFGSAVDILKGGGVAKFTEPKVKLGTAVGTALSLGIDEAGEHLVTVGLLVEGQGEDGFVGGGHVDEAELAKGGYRG